MGVTFYFVSKKNFAKVTKREMDYLILGNVQVVRGLRKGKDQEELYREILWLIRVINFKR